MRGRSNTVFQPSSAASGPPLPLPTLLDSSSTFPIDQEPPTRRSLEVQEQYTAVGPESRKPNTTRVCPSSQGSETPSTAFTEEASNIVTISTRSSTRVFDDDIRAVERTIGIRGNREEQEEMEQNGLNEVERRGVLSQGEGFETAERETRIVIEGLVRQQAERERRIVASQSRLRRKKKWLLIVASSSAASSSSISHSTTTSESSTLDFVGEPVLLPLQSTLPAQAQLIAHEFSLSSITGLSLYLCLPSSPPRHSVSPHHESYNHSSRSSIASLDSQSSETRIRLTEASWKILWADHLDGRDDLETADGASGLPIAGRIQFDLRSPRSRQTNSVDVRFRSESHLPRFGGSQLYARPSTPSWSTSRRSDSRSSSYSRAAVELNPESDEINSRSAFNPRPLSIVSQVSSSITPSTPFDPRSLSRVPTPSLTRPPSPSRTISRSSMTGPSTPTEARSEQQSILLNEPNFESTPLSSSRSISTAFPLPPSDTLRLFSNRSKEDSDEEEDSLEVGGSSLDWTFELNRLKELSETSMFREAGPDVSTTEVSVVQDSDISHLEGTVVNESEHLSSFATTTPLSISPHFQRPPTASSSPSILSRYPFFRIYPPVYPHFDIYPPILASSTSFVSQPRDGSHLSNDDDEAIQPMQEGYAEAAQLAEESFTVDDAFAAESTGLSEQTEESVKVEQSGYNDPSVEWYHSSTPLEHSPASSSYEEDDEDSEGTTDSDGDGEELFGTRYDGIMLTTIPEESYTRGFTAQMESVDSRRGEVTEDVPISELEEDENEQDDSFVALETESPDVPMITRTRPSVSGPSGSDSPPTPRRPVALELHSAPLSPSPLPSPTITPSSVLPADDSTSAENASPAESDQFDYEFEYEVEAGTEELPYLSTPGLREALGFDDSPELQPFPFPTDESDVDSDEGPDFVLEGAAELGEGHDSCQTFDHLSPLPDVPSSRDPSPVVYAIKCHHSGSFPNAVAQFIVEAQNRAIEERGSFCIALGDRVQPILESSLLSDRRVQWNKWQLYFLGGNKRDRAEGYFLRRAPLEKTQIIPLRGGGRALNNAGVEVDDETGVMIAGRDYSNRLDLCILDSCEYGVPSRSFYEDEPGIVLNNPPLSYFPSTLLPARQLAVTVSDSIGLPELLQRDRDTEEGKDRLSDHPVFYLASTGTVSDLNYPVIRFLESGTAIPRQFRWSPVSDHFAEGSE